VEKGVNKQASYTSGSRKKRRNSDKKEVCCDTLRNKNLDTGYTKKGRKVHLEKRMTAFTERKEKQKRSTGGEKPPAGKQRDSGLARDRL